MVQELNSDLEDSGSNLWSASKLPGCPRASHCLSAPPASQGHCEDQRREGTMCTTWGNWGNQGGLRCWDVTGTLPVLQKASALTRWEDSFGCVWEVRPSNPCWSKSMGPQPMDKEGRLDRITASVVLAASTFSGSIQGITLVGPNRWYSEVTRRGRPSCPALTLRVAAGKQARDAFLVAAPRYGPPALKGWPGPFHQRFCHLLKTCLLNLVFYLN